jgi:uncharacterized protein YjbI with pentapeptide repeats
VALVLALFLGWGIYQFAYDYFAQAAADQRPSKPVNVNDVLKATVTALTLVGAVLAGLYAYRKQLLSEGDAHRADASQLADRYTTAAEQLGHDQAAVRLAGVYALARLADDWEEQRQVCIDVLCAYLRMPYQSDPAGERHNAGEREVRWTIIRVIRDHLHDPVAPTSWCTYSLDFTGATFDGGDFSLSYFLGSVSFDRTTFSDGTVNFSNATFSGMIEFDGATFSDGTVDFSNATFSGSVSFDRATFSDGTVNFSNATFSGMIEFDGATFSDGTVDFSNATFSGGRVKVGGFDGAAFSGSTVNFIHATFSDGRVDFDRAMFVGGTVSFDSAELRGGTISFNSATFRGTMVSWAPKGCCRRP